MMNGYPPEEFRRETAAELGSPTASVSPTIGAAALGPFSGQVCCLREEGERCNRPAGNASFSKRIQKSISQKKVKIDLDKTARHLYICDFHKNLIQSVRNRRKRKGSDDDGGDSPVHDADTPEVDLFQLQVNTLRRYKRHFKLQARPGLNKAQLVESNQLSQQPGNLQLVELQTRLYACLHFTRDGCLLLLIIGCHFRTLPVNEKDTLTYFICSVKNEKNKLDHKSDGGLH
uniref:Sin3A-associated protein 30kDa n=1 Tax=Xenopus tropicalis TaxID=8364 RepID=A0A803KHJ4_XENTR